MVSFRSRRKFVQNLLACPSDASVRPISRASALSVSRKSGARLSQSIRFGHHRNARLCWASSLHYGDDFKLYSAS
ncbi:hypothetical protein D0X08_22510 [Escherichia coli]|nr:hypothetical protein [Escherichia coli]